MDKNKQILTTSLSVVSGWTLAKQVGSVLSDAAETGGRMVDLAKTLWKRHEPYQERFEEAAERLDLDEASIQAVATSFIKRATWWLVALGMAVIAFCVAPFTDSPISHGLLSIGVIVLSAAKTLSWRFRYCQVRDRELYAFGPWFLIDPWARRTWLVFVALASIGMLLFAATAHAADAATTTMSIHAFNPPAGDTSIGYLREIYGSVIDRLHSGSAVETGQVDSALGAMLGPYNSAVLFLGMIFVAFTTIKGTVDTAHEGELLGKKMSEIWVPIRTVLGTAFLLPLASGFCLVQIGILWLAIQGVGIADAVLTAGLTYVGETNMVSRPNLPDSRPLAAQIFKAEVCMASMNKQYTDAGDATKIGTTEQTWLVHNGGEVGLVDVGLTGLGAVAAGPVGAVAAAGAVVADATYKVTEFRWAANDGTNKQCGSLTWRESDQSTLGAGNTNIAKAPIMLAQAQAVRQMIKNIRVVAQQLVTSGQAPAAGTIETEAATYESTIAKAASSAITNSKDSNSANFIKFAQDGGWLYLPAYYNQLIQMNDAVQSAINTLPSATAPNIEEQIIVDYALQNYRGYMTIADEYLKRRDMSAANAGDQQATEDNSFPTSWESAKRFLSRPAQVAIYKFTQQLAGSNLSHVAQIKAIGDTISHAGEVLSGIMFTTAGVANSNVSKLTVGNVFDAGAALSSISNILSTIIMALFVFGAWAAYYIPLIPYIAGVTAIIKWFVMVFEIVITSPIMAAAHIHPDGDDAVGKAAPGYMLILSVVMWPAFVVFGFFGSIWLAQPVTGFINATYMTAVLGAEHKSFTGLVALVAYVSIYVLIMTGVVHSIFTLVNWLPTNALRVIGGAIGAHGIADSEEHEAGSKFYGGAGNFQKNTSPRQLKTPSPNGERESRHSDQGEGGPRTDGPSNRDLFGG